MTTVVFTGKCEDRAGNTISREELTVWAMQAGHIVQPKVTYSTTYLVASRDDTSKARDARDMGVNVITYQRYLEMIGHAAVDRGRRGVGDGRMKFVGSAAPGSPNNGDLWQPGGTGPVKVYTQGQGWQDELPAPEPPPERVVASRTYATAEWPTAPNVGDQWQYGGITAYWTDSKVWQITSGLNNAKGSVKRLYRASNGGASPTDGRDSVINEFIETFFKTEFKVWRDEEHALMAAEAAERRRLEEIRPRFMKASSIKRDLDL